MNIFVDQKLTKHHFGLFHASSSSIEAELEWLCLSCDSSHQAAPQPFHIHCHQHWTLHRHLINNKNHQRHFRTVWIIRSPCHISAGFWMNNVKRSFKDKNAITLLNFDGKYFWHSPGSVLQWLIPFTNSITIPVDVSFTCIWYARRIQYRDGKSDWNSTDTKKAEKY